MPRPAQVRYGIRASGCGSSWHGGGWSVGVAALLLGLLISATNLDPDSSMRWQYGLLVLALAALHYVATAIAARAAAGISLPIGETLLVQLAAAAANRLTPAGIGAAAVSVRYFTRRGLRLTAAMGAVAALSVLGAVADLILLSTLVLAGRWFGLSGGSQEINVLATHVEHLVAPVRSPWLWSAAAAVATGLALIWIWSGCAGLTHRGGQFWTPAARMLRHPLSLAILLLASGATTLILGFAFIASTAMIPGPSPHTSLGALLVGFMVGAAAGSAVPVPAGVGSTEAALVAVLIQVQVPASHALAEVLVFRILTFWLPAALGMLALRRLRRRRAL
ncbi:MAG: YbhN family protein [Jatrophihabitantaceae bacterium]